MVNGETLAAPQLELIEMNAHPDFRVSRDQPDPRGWPLRAQDERAVGTVVDLIVDPQVMTVRYLVGEIGEQRRVLIPTGFGRVEVETQMVHLDFITADALERLPTYGGLPLSAHQKLEIETALTLRERAEPDPLIRRRQETT